MLATTVPGSKIQITGTACVNAGRRWGIAQLARAARVSDNRAVTATLARQNAEVMRLASASVASAMCGSSTCETACGTYQSSSTKPMARE